MRSFVPSTYFQDSKIQSVPQLYIRTKMHFSWLVIYSFNKYLPHLPDASACIGH